MDKYEYKTIFTDTGLFGAKVDQTVFENQLNELGCLGWDLVSTVATGISGRTMTVVSVFKRKI